MFTYHYNTFDRLVQVDDVNGTALGRYYYDPWLPPLETGGRPDHALLYSDEGLWQNTTRPERRSRSYGYRPDSTYHRPLVAETGWRILFLSQRPPGHAAEARQAERRRYGAPATPPSGRPRLKWEITNNLRFPGAVL